MNKFKSLTIALVMITATVVFASYKIKDIDAKHIKGAWEQGPAEKRTVMILTDKVFSVATYDGPGKKFIGSYGGTWYIKNDKLIRTMEWNTIDTNLTGKITLVQMKLNKGKLTLIGSGSNEPWTRVDDGKAGDLTGAWIITGNYANGKVSKRPAPFFPRRTMKVLSGTRFHWIAYNVQTKQFMNAGGGSYTAADGKYTEHVEFFTKTPESVGKTLAFQYSFVDGDWRHKGEKSTGGTMDECWSRRETLEK